MLGSESPWPAAHLLPLPSIDAESSFSRLVRQEASNGRLIKGEECAEHLGALVRNLGDLGRRPYTRYIYEIDGTPSVALDNVCVRPGRIVGDCRTRGCVQMAHADV